MLPVMAGNQRSQTTAKKVKRLFSHRSLVAVEALLVVGLIETIAEDAVVAQTDLPNWAKVLFSMVLVVGLFGGLMLLFERWAQRGIDRTHGVVKSLPVPTPVLAIHGALLVAIFFGYAWHMDLMPW